MKQVVENEEYIVCTDNLNPLYEKSYEKIISLIVEYPLWLKYVENQTLKMCIEVLSRNPYCIDYVDQRFYAHLGIKLLTTFERDKFKLFYYRGKYWATCAPPMTADVALKHWGSYTNDQLAKLAQFPIFHIERIRSTQYHSAIVENESLLIT